MCSPGMHAFFIERNLGIMMQANKAASLWTACKTHIRSFSLPPEEKHIDVLDGFRALFVLLIARYHIWQLGWLWTDVWLFGEKVQLDYLLQTGYIWVDGLMLLSGFLLFLPYTGKSKPVPILTFYKRRLIRILPSYLLCIIPLFILALIEHKYASTGDAVKDLAAHLTFTHTLFPFSYQQTPLNGALWTLAVEMQFYLIFPLLGWCFKKKPGITWLFMTSIAFLWRWHISALPDNSLYINQLPAFLDVYANGFAAASIFATLRNKMDKNGGDTRLKVFFTVIFFLCICLIVPLLQGQAQRQGYENIRLGQLENRFGFSVLLACAMISAAFSLPFLRFLLGNKLMAFLSAISLQLYIWHQWLSARIRDWDFIPHNAPAQPWASAADQLWRQKYTIVCFAAAIIVAGLITYLYEKPIARKLRK